MFSHRFFSIAAMAAFIGIVGCDTADREFEQTETDIFTEPATEEVEVEIMTEDTFMVERTVETEVDIDTTQIEGDEVPAATESRTDDRY